LFSDWILGIGYYGEAVSWWAGEELNLHGYYPTAPLTLRVCQFRHRPKNYCVVNFQFPNSSMPNRGQLFIFIVPTLGEIDEDWRDW